MSGRRVWPSSAPTRGLQPIGDPVRRGLLGLLVLVVGVACGGQRPVATGTVIDTWPIGEMLACDPTDRCAELIRVGLEGLAVRDGPQIPIAWTQVYTEGSTIDPVTGQGILLTRSGGCCRVLVVGLVDGSRHAIGVGFVGISDKASSIPWETPPWR